MAERIPDFARDNTLDLVPASAGPRIWIGNATIVQTHFDLNDNIACVLAGRRRFTLFPPDQIGNLYVGPLDFTISGPPVSMVALNAPDFARFPRFAEAQAAAQVAELEPGDAIFIPYGWWHQVRRYQPSTCQLNYCGTTISRRTARRLMQCCMPLWCCAICGAAARRARAV